MRSDRAAEYGLAPVSGRRWDVVMDLSRQPGFVRRAVRDLAPVASHMVFVSSASVYSRTSAARPTEAALTHLPLSDDVMASMADYAPATVACEGHVLRGFGAERCSIIRTGLLGGPGDTTGRSGYWPWRFAHPSSPSGKVLAPRSPDLLCQILDARDLAAWVVRLAEVRVAGTFSAAGDPVPFAHVLHWSRALSHRVTEVVEADAAWLANRQVSPWTGPRSLPLWLPRGSSTVLDTDAATRAGLRRRPLTATLGDTLSFEEGRGAWIDRAAGLTDGDEVELLAELAAATAANSQHALPDISHVS